MFVLVLRDGSCLAIEVDNLLEAMREAVRVDADLRVEGAAPRIMRHAEIMQALSLDRPGLFDAYHINWQPPSAAEFRELLKVARLTGSQAGQLVGVPSGKIRKWAGGDSSPPYAVWRLLTIYAGLAEAEILCPTALNRITE